MRDGNESGKHALPRLPLERYPHIAMKHGDEVEDWYELTPSLVTIDAIRDHDDVNVLNWKLC